MAEAKTYRSGLVARLRDRLLIAASARHLAIDLVERHGDAAADVARALLDRGGLTREERLVLTKAGPTIALLIAESAGAPCPARRMAPATQPD